jgi:hypothetical protein
MEKWGKSLCMQLNVYLLVNEGGAWSESWSKARARIGNSVCSPGEESECMWMESS